LHPDGSFSACFKPPCHITITTITSTIASSVIAIIARASPSVSSAVNIIAHATLATTIAAPILRTSEYPEGLPEDQIPSDHRKELKNTNRLLDRVVNIAIAAHNSSAKTTIIFENPADISEGRGMYDL